MDTTDCRKVTVYDYLGRPNTFPIVRCYLKCPYYEGWADAIRAPIKFAISDIPGAGKPDDPSWTSELNVPVSIFIFQEQDARSPLRATPVTQESSNSLLVDASPSESELFCAVQTRVASTRVRRLHPFVLPDLQPLKVTPTDLARLQETCPSLGAVRANATAGLTEVARNGEPYKFSWTNGLLYRDVVASGRSGKVGTRTLVLPSDCRQIVLQVAHESPRRSLLSSED